MIEPEEIRRLVAQVYDPEIPVLTIDDLGILRDVSVDGETVSVTITPTYSGCPALDTIATDIKRVLHEAGIRRPQVRTVLAPAWTTDWMSDDGKRKLIDFGIAPPGPAVNRRSAVPGPVPLALSLRCPQCGSPRTRELSRFGSTACKSLWVCDECWEPFDHFKAL